MCLCAYVHVCVHIYVCVSMRERMNAVNVCPCTCAHIYGLCVSVCMNVVSSGSGCIFFSSRAQLALTRIQTPDAAMDCLVQVPPGIVWLFCVRGYLVAKDCLVVLRLLTGRHRAVRGWLKAMATTSNHWSWMTPPTVFDAACRHIDELIETPFPSTSPLEHRSHFCPPSVLLCLTIPLIPQCYRFLPGTASIPVSNPNPT